MARSKWKCPKCGLGASKWGEIHSHGTGLAALVSIPTRVLTSVTCRVCSYTEFYAVPASDLDRVLALVWNAQPRSQ